METKKQEDGDYLFLGLVSGFETELCYFTLSEVMSVNHEFPRIEMDLYFEPITIGKLKQQLKN